MLKTSHSFQCEYQLKGSLDSCAHTHTHSDRMTFHIFYRVIRCDYLRVCANIHVTTSCR